MVCAEKILAQLNSFCDDVRIEALPIPFTAVATDLVSEREVWFQSGKLTTAMRASFAIPTFISPVQVEGRILADGSLLNPVPVEPTLPVISDVSVAVSLSARDVPSAIRSDSPRRLVKASRPLPSKEAGPVGIKNRVPYASASTLDFHHAAQIIQVGRELASEAFDDAGIGAAAVGRARAGRRREEPRAEGRKPRQGSRFRGGGHPCQRR
ncbi:patatin-like phospholipase family protein [Trueperella pecoris]|uniref:patatin-like phospholipase family protein n=1 Tax=Trueperella pecoris TaxID=2733571 RepID=UPI00350F7A51